MAIEMGIEIPRKILGFTLHTSQYRRALPSAWSDIHDERRRLFFVRMLTLMSFETAQEHILRDILKLSERCFRQIDSLDVTAMLEKLEWMRLAPSTKPIVKRFKHKGIVYHFPKTDFLGSTAQEFALADDYYNQFVKDSDQTEPALKLLATLARPYDSKHNQRTGDPRSPLSIDPSESEHFIETNATLLADVDFSVVLAALCFWQGISQKVTNQGLKVGIFEKNKAEENQNTKLNNANLFGWWTSFRIIAKLQLKTEEQIWAMSFWRVFSIMLEEHNRQKELKNTE